MQGFGPNQEVTFGLDKTSWLELCTLASEVARKQCSERLGRFRSCFELFAPQRGRTLGTPETQTRVPVLAVGDEPEVPVPGQRIRGTPL